MAALEFKLKAFHMLILDLNEIWFGSDTTSRNIDDLTDGDYRKIAENIRELIIGYSITSRTIREYVKGNMSKRRYCFDLLAASWFIAIGLNSKEDLKYSENFISGKWKDYFKIFINRKAEIMTIIGKPEGSKLEYKAEFPKATEIAETISAFANRDGGYIIMGVAEEGGKPEIVGLNINVQAVHITRAAISNLSNKPKLEYGWAYKFESEKMMFMIKVKKLDSSKLTKAEGKAYLRVGEHNKPYDEVMKINEYNVKHFESATEFRHVLVENYRSVKSNIEDLFTYYDEYKTHSASKHEKMVFLFSSFSFVIDTFIQYLLDIVDKINQETLPNRGYNYAKNTLELVTDNLRKGEVIIFMNYIQDIPEIHHILLAELEKLNLIFQINRINIRNKGIIDGEFLKYYSSKEYQVNSAYEIKIKNIDSAISYLNNISAKIDLALSDKYKLAQSKVEQLNYSYCESV